MNNSHIALLREQVLNLPVSAFAHRVLLQSIEYFQDHLCPNSSQRGGQLALKVLQQDLASGITDRVMQERYR